MASMIAKMREPRPVADLETSRGCKMLHMSYPSWFENVRRFRCTVLWIWMFFEPYTGDAVELSFVLFYYFPTQTLALHMSNEILHRKECKEAARKALAMESVITADRKRFSSKRLVSEMFTSVGNSNFHVKHIIVKTSLPILTQNEKNWNLGSL